MKNGDMLHLRQQTGVFLVPTTRTADDTPMGTLEELNALFARI